MKMAKTILLGTAAALVGTVGASAADLRAAPPVQFVQVCDAAGAGFWVLPGSDVCISVGGWVFAGIYARSSNINTASLPPGVAATGNNVNGQGAHNFLRLQPFNGAAGTAGVVGPNTSPTSQLYGNGRIRGQSFQRTDFGIVRTDVIISGDNGADGTVNGTGFGGFVLRRAAVTVTNAAGVFTAGLTQSFFNQLDMGGSVTTGGHGWTVGDTIGNPAARTQVLAYTAVLAPNLTATLALQQSTNQVLVGAGGAAVGAAAGQTLPDLVGNVVWGTGASGNFVQLSGAVVNNRAFVSAGAANAARTGATSTSTGYALAVLGSVNLDMISRGSRFLARAAFSDGATAYLGNGLAGSTWMTGTTNNSRTAGTLANVQGWAFSAAYVHQWNAQWRTTLYGGVTGLNYRGGADFAAANISGGNLFVNNGTPSFLNVGVGAGSVTNTSLVGWNVTNLVRTSWNAGGNIIWTPVNNFTVGIDVFVTGARFANTFGGNGSGLGSYRTGYGAQFAVGRGF